MKHADGQSIWAFGELTTPSTMLRFIPTIFAAIIESLFIFLISLLVELITRFDIFYKANYHEDIPFPYFNRNLEYLQQRTRELMESDLMKKLSA